MGTLLKSGQTQDLPPVSPNSPQRNYPLKYLSVHPCGVCGLSIRNAVIPPKLLLHTSLPLPPPLTPASSSSKDRLL